MSRVLPNPDSNMFMASPQLTSLDDAIAAPRDTPNEAARDLASRRSVQAS